MEVPQPRRAVAFELSSLGYALAKGFREAMATFDLHPRDFGLLRTLAAQEGQSQQAIADRLQIPPSRVVAIVDALEARGLVERRPHASDRRIRELYLTSAGQELFREAAEHAEAYERGVTASLDDGERDQLLDLLGRLAGSLGIGTGPGAPHAALDEAQDQAAARA